MELEELIKKMENMEVPPIEIRAHKQKLRMALLNSECFKGKASIFSFKRIMFLTSATAVTIVVLSVTVINPRLMEASAMEIVRKDPQIQKIILENKMFIKEIKIKDGHAFALLVPVENDLKSMSAEETGSVAEINIGGSKVEKVNNISLSGVSLSSEEEKAKTLTILGNDPQTKDFFSKVDKDKVILKPVTSLNLDIEDGDDRVSLSFGNMEDKIMAALFEVDGNGYLATVNLTREAVEKVQAENKEENNNSSLSSKVLGRIGEAEKKMEEAKTLIRENNSEAVNSLLNNAVKHLESAKEAHGQDKYGEAFGQANAALNDVNNAVKDAEKENDSKKNTESEIDDGKNINEGKNENLIPLKSGDKANGRRSADFKDKEGGRRSADKED
jgi:hypothetical protein